MEWNGPYAKRLVPFIGFSIVLHILIITVLFGMNLLYAEGQGLTVTLFDPGQPGIFKIDSPLLAGFEAPERMKIFRIDFFREIVPWLPPPPPEPEIIIEEPIIPEVVEPEIVEEIEEEPDVEPEVEEEIEEEIVEEIETEIEPELIEEEAAISTDDGESVLIGDPDDLIGGSAIPDSENDLLDETDGFGRNIPRDPILPDSEDEILPDSLVMYGMEGDEAGSENVLAMPEWELPGLENLAWTHEFFLDNYTIYIVADISRRHGMEELLAWNYVLKMLITNPQAAWPPHMINVGTAMENPYAFNNNLILTQLQAVADEENTFGVMIADSDGLIPKSLGYRELVQPFVMFVDNNGFVRLIMQGRVRDISNNSINSAMGVIADMWQWDENEMSIMPTAVTLLINLVRDQAYEQDERKVEPPEGALEISPTWGYPELIPDRTYLRPEDREDYVHF